MPLPRFSLLAVGLEVREKHTTVRVLLYPPCPCQQRLSIQGSDTIAVACAVYFCFHLGFAFPVGIDPRPGELATETRHTGWIPVSLAPICVQFA